MKDTYKKLLSAGLTGVMLLGCLTGCGAEQSTASDPDAAAEAELITQTANTLLPSHSDTEGKEETVYVIADAAGNPTETIVSAWLKNPDGASTLEDHSDLSDIQNVKGSETFTDNGGGHITWAADGSDIYYQGTTDKELPVTTAITYELDGKAVSADELAGASGHLVITFDYTNNTAAEREVNGELVTLYQPFLVISGLMLDGDTASNITVSNGKVINTGEQSVVVGMAMPGLKESLGLDTMKDRDGEPIDMDIPESVVIEADVQDFELLTTVTILSNNALSSLDLDDVHTFDDLTDDMEELTDASTQLVDGTGDLYDGVEGLSGGTTELTDGIAQLDDGASDLKSGAEELSGGVSQLSDGADTLSQGAGTLATGASQVSYGAAALDEGMQTLNDSAPALEDGAAAAAEGAAALSEGASQVNTGASALAEGTSQLSEGAESLSSGAGDLAAGASAAASGASDLAAGAAAVDAGAQQVSGNMSDLSTGLDSARTGAESLESGLTQMQTTIADLPSGVDALYQGTLMVSGALKNDSGQSLYTGAQAIEDGTDTISAGLTGEDSSILTAANGIADGAQQLAAGAEDISTAASALQETLSEVLAIAEGYVDTAAAMGIDASEYIAQANAAYYIS